MKKILLTGFEPFGGQALNPSEKLVSALMVSRGDVEGLILPVSFAESFRAFQSRFDPEMFHAVVMLGQAVGRRAVSLERVALNWQQSRGGDEDSRPANVGRIRPDGVEAVIVDLPLEEWQRQLSSIGEVEVSLSAGAYVCNYLYYCVLSELVGKMPVLFVHVPLLPEQVLEGESRPSMAFETQLAMVQKILNLIGGSAVQGD